MIFGCGGICRVLVVRVGVICLLWWVRIVVVVVSCRGVVSMKFWLILVLMVLLWY